MLPREKPSTSLINFRSGDLHDLRPFGELCPNESAEFGRSAADDIEALFENAVTNIRLLQAGGERRMQLLDDRGRRAVRHHHAKPGRRLHARYAKLRRRG